MDTKRKKPTIRFKGFNDDWELCKLGSVVESVYGGGTPKPSISEYWDGGIPWIQSSNLQEEQLFEVDIQKSITEVGLEKSAAKLVPANSIAVVTHVGVGKLVYMPFQYATSQDFTSLSDLKTDVIFTCYSLYKRLQSELHVVQGSAIKGITKDDLLTKEIMIPCLEEQRKIGAYFEKLDRLITLHQCKYDNLTKVKKTMLEKMFPKRGANVPEIRFKGFTEAWEQCKLSSKIIDIADGPFGSNLKKEHYTEEKEARIVQLSNLSDEGWQEENTRYTTFEHAREIQRCIVNKGEMVMGKMMPAGMTIMRPDTEKMYVLSSDCIRIKLDENNITNVFFLYETKSVPFLDQVNNDSQGSTRVRTSISKIRDMNIMVPILEEQQKLSDYFLKLDHLITLHRKQLEKLKYIKQAMLSKMFV